MGERKRSRTSNLSPLATVQDIQRRLVRPSSSSSSAFPPPTSTFSSTQDVQSCHKQSSQFQLRTTKKLEDYLDSALLSQVSSKISRSKKVPETKSPKKEVKDFEWPIDALNVLVDQSEKEAVNLKDDLDLREEIGDGDEESCTPFRRFEQIALRRFKG